LLRHRHEEARTGCAHHRLRFQYDGGLGKGGLGTLRVDSKTVAMDRIERTLPFRIAVDETLDIGEDTGTPVSESYRLPFKFTGEIKRMVIDLTPERLSAEDGAKLTLGKAAAIRVAQ
jgi:hypothetical protein